MFSHKTPGNLKDKKREKEKKKYANSFSNFIGGEEKGRKDGRKEKSGQFSVTVGIGFLLLCSPLCGGDRKRGPRRESLVGNEITSRGGGG